MATLGWLGWRSIWAPPKGGEAATVLCMKRHHAQTPKARIRDLPGPSGSCRCVAASFPSKMTSLIEDTMHQDS
jgi:hypothetical protein